MKRMMMITAMTSFCFILAVLGLNPRTEQHWCDGGGRLCQLVPRIFGVEPRIQRLAGGDKVREMAAFRDQNIAF